MTREEWLFERRKGLGASDVPAALGFSTLRTPLEVWCEKTGSPLLPEKEPSDLMEWGLDVEPGIARAYERLTGRTIIRQPYRLIRHPEYPELFCTPDGITAEPSPRLVQLKWSRWADGFGDPGSDRIPDAYLIQCAMEMACVGCDLEDLAAMVMGPPVLVYPLHRDRELEEQLIEAARAWWNDYVLKYIEPPIDCSASWGDYLKKKFPWNSGEWLEAGEPGDALRDEVDRLLQARREADEAQEREEQSKNRLKAFIADYDGIRFPGGQISWRRERDHREDVTDWATLFTVLCGEFKVPVERQKQLKDVYTEFGVVTRKGNRKFIVREEI